MGLIYITEIHGCFTQRNREKVDEKQAVVRLVNFRKREILDAHSTIHEFEVLKIPHILILKWEIET